jgi:hypothetical protein
LTKSREHENLAVRNLLVKHFGRRQTIHSRQIDVEDRHVWPSPDGCLEDLVTTVKFRDNLHVGFPREQRDQGASDEVHVFGDQNAYHTNASGISTESR